MAMILLLALCLRLVRLGTFSYWHDEVHNLIASEDLYALIFHGNLVSNHPPLPYVLVAAWRALGMDASEWLMRLLPAFAGTATVGAMFVLTRRIADLRAAIAASLLLAISPLHVYHSQDLKEYIYLPFVAQIMVLFFYRAIENNKRADWILYGVLAGIACYTEIFVGPMLVAINLWALHAFRTRPGRWKGWLLGNVIGALMFVPWLGIMLRKAVATMINATTWWLPAPTWVNVAIYLKSVAFGYSAPNPWHQAALALFAVFVLAGAVMICKRNAHVGSLLLMWTVLPVVIVFVVSHITESIFLVRALLPYAMALYILAGIGLAGMKPSALRGLLAACVLITSSVGLVYHYLRIYPIDEFPHRPGIHNPRDTAGASQYIRERWQEGDVVIHSSCPTWLTFYWYGFRGQPQYNAGMEQDYIDFILAGTPRNSTDPLIEGYWPREPEGLVKGAKRVWFVFGDWERAYLGGNASNTWRWLDARYHEIDHVVLEDVEVGLYVPEGSVMELERDKDNGVRSTIRHAHHDTPYIKFYFDAGQVPSPIEDRAGRLELRWGESNAAGSEQRLFAGNRAARPVTFQITNNSNEPVDLSASFVPSDVLVNVASFSKTDPQSSVWRVYGQHNPTPPPDNYSLSVASGHFDGPGAATLERLVTLPVQQYSTYFRTLGPPGNLAHLRAAIDITLGDVPLFISPPGGVQGDWKWGWQSGQPVNVIDAPQVLKVSARHEGEGAAYADLSSIAFVRPREGIEIAYAEEWPGRLRLAAGESRSFTASIDADLARADVWVYESGELGKAYYIFKRFAL